MMPSKLHYVGVWQWDAYFHTLAYRHIDKYLARDQIRIFIDHQRADGLIPDAVHDEGTITHLTFPIEADVTKPPLLAWAVWKMYQTDNDAEFLAEIYEPLVRYNRWWFSENDPNQDGLCEYLHPFSSGLDDSPLWDAGMPVTSPDLNTYLVLQMENLARIANVLGLQDEAAEWEQRAQELVERMIARLWDGEAGLFWAKRDGEIVNAKTPFNLFPLITGRLPEEINRKLVAHLFDPQSFWTRYPVPTVARDDPSYEPMVMWRGPTWINVNYLLVEGLSRIGRTELAADLRQRTFELVNGYKDIYEYYNPETGEPGLKAAPVFGWSAALIIDLAIEESREKARS
jgi:glycogen debranching enzyme